MKTTNEKSLGQTGHKREQKRDADPEHTPTPKANFGAHSFARSTRTRFPVDDILPTSEGSKMCSTCSAFHRCTCSHGAVQVQVWWPRLEPLCEAALHGIWKRSLESCSVLSGTSLSRDRASTAIERGGSHTSLLFSQAVRFDDQRLGLLVGSCPGTCFDTTSTWRGSSSSLHDSQALTAWHPRFANFLQRPSCHLCGFSLRSTFTGTWERRWRPQKEH